MDACLSTEDPRTCDAATVTMASTKVDAFVSTKDPQTCDAATLTMDPTVMCAAYTQRPGWTMVVLLRKIWTWNWDEKPEDPGTRGGAGVLKEIDLKRDAQHE